MRGALKEDVIAHNGYIRIRKKLLERMSLKQCTLFRKIRQTLCNIKIHYITYVQLPY